MDFGMGNSSLVFQMSQETSSVKCLAGRNGILGAH